MARIRLGSIYRERQMQIEWRRGDIDLPGPDLAGLVDADGVGGAEVDGAASLVALGRRWGLRRVRLLVLVLLVGSSPPLHALVIVVRSFRARKRKGCGRFNLGSKRGGGVLL